MKQSVLFCSNSPEVTQLNLFASSLLIPIIDLVPPHYLLQLKPMQDRTAFTLLSKLSRIHQKHFVLSEQYF